MAPEPGLKDASLDHLGDVVEARLGIFHIFALDNHLFRNGKRILANEKITRFVKLPNIEVLRAVENLFYLGQEHGF